MTDNMMRQGALETVQEKQRIGLIFWIVAIVVEEDFPAGFVSGRVRVRAEGQSIVLCIVLQEDWLSDGTFQ